MHAAGGFAPRRGGHEAAQGEGLREGEGAGVAGGHEVEHGALAFLAAAAVEPVGIFLVAHAQVAQQGGIPRDDGAALGAAGGGAGDVDAEVGGVEQVVCDVVVAEQFDVVVAAHGAGAAGAAGKAAGEHHERGHYHIVEALLPVVREGAYVGAQGYEFQLLVLQGGLGLGKGGVVPRLIFQQNICPVEEEAGAHLLRGGAEEPVLMAAQVECGIHPAGEGGNGLAPGIRLGGGGALCAQPERLAELGAPEVPDARVLLEAGEQAGICRAADVESAALLHEEVDDEHEQEIALLAHPIGILQRRLEIVHPLRP